MYVLYVYTWWEGNWLELFEAGRSNLCPQPWFLLPWQHIAEVFWNLLKTPQKWSPTIQSCPKFSDHFGKISLITGSTWFVKIHSKNKFYVWEFKSIMLRQCIQEMNHAIRKMPKFQLISWYGNFVETAGRFAQNSEGIIRFHKISTTGNWVKFRYSMQWWDHASKIWLTRNHDSYKILNVTELKFTESPSFFRINIINSFVYQANLYNSFVLCHIYHNQIQANLLNEWKFEIQLIEI